ncbi:MAG: hypothetical protein LBQ54_06350 [Planctomycetaceae bacterium]|jgi:hypothetical protein|nr:hypothetical protein [Planctomycetaceae bacterium]
MKNHWSHWSLRLFVIFLGMTVFPGCGSNIPLSGKIIYEDGTPLKTGMLNFASETTLSRAKIQPDGSYVVGTSKEKDGLPEGKYKVYITGAEEAVEPKNAPVKYDSMGTPVTVMGRYRQLVNRKYLTADKTPLVCDVPAPKNRFDITIEKPDYLK